MIQTAVDWLFVYPQGMEKLVMYMKDRFNNTPVIITENGNRKVKVYLYLCNFRNTKIMTY